MEGSIDESTQCRELDYSQRRLSASSEERTIFYIDDMSPPAAGAGGSGAAAEPISPSSDYGQSFDCPRHHQPSQQQHYRRRQLAEPSEPGGPSPRPRQQRRRNSSVTSQSQNGPGGGSTRARRQRRPSEFLEHTARRSSTFVHPGSNRPRANSIARPTPLGDGRRASVCKKPRSRRASTAGRRESMRPQGSRSPSVLLTPTSLEAGGLPAGLKDPREAERARRHQRIAGVLLATFIFILGASVLAVIVTLTHSSFHRPPTGSRELAEHRANNDLIADNERTPQGERGVVELVEPGLVAAGKRDVLAAALMAGNSPGLAKDDRPEEYPRGHSRGLYLRVVKFKPDSS